MASENAPNQGSPEVSEPQEKRSEPAPAGQATTPPAEAASTTDLQNLLTQKDEELQQLRDRLLRQAADMENTRKRLERERSEAITFANESILKGLLPVVDNLERALEHGDKEASNQSLLEGVAITLKAFRDQLARFGCVPFDAASKPFDPNFHEAVLQEESDEHAENTVLREIQKGYLLHERLLRPALVIVSKSSAARAESQAAGEEPPKATSPP
jgi:molecular chaperone GrpE